MVACRIADFAVTAVRLDGSTEYTARGGSVHKAVQALTSQLEPLRSRLAACRETATLGLERPTVNLTDDRFLGPPELPTKVREALKAALGPSGSELKRAPLATSASVGSGNKAHEDTSLA